MTPYILSNLRAIRLIISGIVLILTTEYGFCQENDSIQTFFIGNGNSQRFKILYEGKVKLDEKVKGNFIYSFKITRDHSWKKNDPMHQILVLRKGRYGLSFHNTLLQVYYENDKKFLVIRKNPLLKSNVAVDYFWTNDEPSLSPAKLVLER